MKKVIKLTETQLKKVIEKIIAEQSEDRKYTIAIQKFLNDKRVLNANLEKDGKTGRNSKTAEAIEKLQLMLNVYPTDGVWGPDTVTAMKEKRPDLYKIWKSYEPGIFW